MAIIARRAFGKLRSMVGPTGKKATKKLGKDSRLGEKNSNACRYTLLRWKVVNIELRNGWMLRCAGGNVVAVWLQK